VIVGDSIITLEGGATELLSKSNLILDHLPHGEHGKPMWGTERERRYFQGNPVPHWASPAAKQPERSKETQP